jgi:hypothetical protein
MNLQALFILCLAVLPAPSHAATQEGLVAARSKNLDELHLRSNADLAGYRKVLIDPVQVELAKDWLAHTNAYNRSPSRWITPDEVRRIAEESAASLQAAVTEAFKARGYEIVTTPGPGVVRLSASAVDFYVNAPDGLSPWRTRTFTREAGDAKLLLEARNAESGTLLARASHRGIAREVGRLNLANEISNRFWFEALFSRWAANCVTEFEANRP